MTAFDLELPATVDHLAVARHRLRAWLAAEVADPTARDDLLAVAGEFFLHAVYRTGGRGVARVVAERGDGGVRLAVTSPTAEASVRSLVPRGDPLADGEIGRRLVEGCCDDVRVVRDDGVAVECFRRVG